MNELKNYVCAVTFYCIGSSLVYGMFRQYIGGRKWNSWYALAGIVVALPSWLTLVLIWNWEKQMSKTKRTR
jgi:hypothetical protein